MKHAILPCRHFSIVPAFFLIFVFSSFANAQTFTDKSIQLSDYTQHFFIQEIPIKVSGLPAVMDSSFGLEKVQLTIHHNRVSDLKIQLQAPDGNTVWVTNRNGGIDGKDYLKTIFTQYGKDGLINNAKAPFLGQFTPSGQFSYFTNASNPNGIWKLLVEDLQDSLEGHLDSVSITFGKNPALIRTTHYCDFDHPELCQCNPDNTCELLPDLVIVPSFTKNQYTEFAWNDPLYPQQLKLSVAIGNIGRGPMEIKADGINAKLCCGKDSAHPIPNIRYPISQNIYSKEGNQFVKKSIKAGTIYYESMPGHQHYHVDDWVEFRLVKYVKGQRQIVAKGNKVSYCLFTTGMFIDGDSSSNIDGKNYGASMPNYSLGDYFTCNLGKQGISVGGYDYYGMMYEGQYLKLPTHLKNGKYILEIEIDPHHWYKESNKFNNIFTMEVVISKQR